MRVIPGKINESVTAEAFTKQSGIFDDIYSGNTIVSYKRKRVRTHVLKYLNPNSHILELNSGTGEDAIYFAKKGHRIHATDLSSGMQYQLRQKIASHNLTKNVSTELCSYTQLKNLANKGPYDIIFSNFAGLNCTDKLEGVLLSLSPLLKKGGTVTIVLLPQFCLWEILLLFKGKFKTATRRLMGKNGANAHIEGTSFKCWYYNPGFIVDTLKDSFELLDLEGLCTIVPPSYIEGFAEKYPKTYQLLVKTEDSLKRQWPWKFIGDYYIITLRKR